MLLNKKAQVHHIGYQELTSRNYLTSRDSFRRCVVNTPLTDVPLIALLRRVRTVALPMPCLITVPARMVGRRSLGIAGPSVPPRKSNGVPLVEPRLRLILLCWRIVSHIRGWSMILGPSCHWSLGLRCPGPGLKSSLASLGRSVHCVVILFGKNITNKLIEGGTLSAAHSLQQLGAKTPLEASNLL